MSTFRLKRGDTSPAIKYQLVDDTGAPVDISGADVRFLVEDHETLLVDDDRNGNVSVPDPTKGIVRYDWQPADTQGAGIFDAEWEVTYSDGTTETFPNTEDITVRIIQDIG